MGWGDERIDWGIRWMKFVICNATVYYAAENVIEKENVLQKNE